MRMYRAKHEGVMENHLGKVTSNHQRYKWLRAEPEERVPTSMLPLFCDSYT